METALEFRLTRDIQASTLLNEILDILSLPVKEHIPVTAIITAREQGKRIHTHSLIFTDIKEDTVRKRLKAYFKVSGNKDYKISAIKNIDSALSYVTKDGDYVVTNNFESLVKPLDQIKPWQDNSLDFEGRVKKLDQEYMETDMSDDSYLDSLLSLHAEFGTKSFQQHHIRSHWLALFNRRNRLSVKRTYTMNGYEEEQYYPRQVLIKSIKNYIL